MKAFCLKSPGVVGYCDVPDPILTPWGAILEPVAVAPCTSDVNTAFGGGSPKAPNLVFGHECVGRIVEIGPNVKDFIVGEIVAVPSITPDWRDLDIQNGNYGHAGGHFSGHKLGRSEPGIFSRYFHIEDADTTLAKIPEGVSIKQALMCVDMVATGFTAAEGAEIKFGDTVCVLGIGPVGLMAIVGAKLSGAGKIIAVGSRSVCVNLAGKYGATDILSYKEVDIVEKVLEMTNQRGPDSVIIAGGNDDVFTQAVDMVCYGTGVISNVKYFGGQGTLGFPKFSGGRGMAGKTIHTLLSKGGRDRIQRIMAMIQCGRFDPSPLVTHELSGFENIEKGLFIMKDKPNNLVKVMVEI